MLTTVINKKRCRLQKLTFVCGNHSTEYPRTKLMCFIGKKKKAFIQAEVFSSSDYKLWWLIEDYIRYPAVG